MIDTKEIEPDAEFIRNRLYPIFTSHMDRERRIAELIDANNKCLDRARSAESEVNWLRSQLAKVTSDFEKCEHELVCISDQVYQ